MNWASWNDFFAMGGYGPYVWGSLSVVLGAFGLELALLARRERLARRAARQSGAREVHS
ncbi:MAG: heme exporter protein CcmD [Pseudomonadota bacterium]